MSWLASSLAETSRLSRMQGRLAGDAKPEVWDRVIRVAPAMRLEGHAQINVFLDEQGEVEDTVPTP